MPQITDHSYPHGFRFTADAPVPPQHEITKVFKYSDTETVVVYGVTAQTKIVSNRFIEEKPSPPQSVWMFSYRGTNGKRIMYSNNYVSEDDAKRGRETFIRDHGPQYNPVKIIGPIEI